MTAIAEFDTPYAVRDRQSRNRALVRGWLYLVLLVMFALFLVGGATRLTDSGLSITEWKPIHGVVPPLTDAEWQEEFAKYQQIPEYRQINDGHDARRLQDDLLVGMGASHPGARASASCLRCRCCCSGRPAGSRAP